MNVVRWKRFVLAHWPLVLAFVTLGLLLFKNPFSERNLIGNFDPFPDSFHYVTPPRCWLQGRGWRLCRPDLPGIEPAVPPLYSILFVPLFVMNNDPRMFYFANVMLSLSSLLIFYLIVRLQTKHPLIIGLSLFLYVTNYFIYWYPTLAMAENLILTLSLLGIYATIHNLKKFHLKLLVMALVIAVAIYLTKPAFGPLVPLFVGWTLIAAMMHRQKFSVVVQRLALIGGALVLAALLIVNARHIWWVASSVFDTTPFAEREMRGGWFSPFFWQKHFPQYVGALYGKSIPFLWDRTPMMVWWAGVGGIAGLIVLTLQKNRSKKLAGLMLLSLLWGQLAFIASFYALDGRYIYHAIPILLIGLSIFLEFIRKKTRLFPKSTAFWLVFAVLGGHYLLTHALILKKQVMLNLKYAEQPWWYLSVKHIDKVMSGLPASDKPRYLIVAHPPFLFDFYASGDYRLLPLTPLQEFRENKRSVVWGNFDYTDYLTLYKSLLGQNNEVYLTNYGLGNDKGYYADFKSVENSFLVTQLATGCYNLCNVYRVELRP